MQIIFRDGFVKYMEKKIYEAVCRYGMEEIYNGAIVGFSGGADSSALLHYLKGKCSNLLAIHVNHMIRGEEADRDEAFCRSVCKKYGVELLVFSVDIPALAREKRQGLEQTAREERYRIFNEVLSSNPRYKRIVTAHNANDNAETVVFNLARGSGANGLSGIKPVYENVCRPLIYSSRNDIIKYCNDNNIEYVIDSTNDDTDYTRNRIRHAVIPELLKINPGLLTSCIRLGEILRADEEYISKEANRVIDMCIGGKISKEIAVSLDDAVLARVLKSVSGRNIEYSTVKACRQLIENWKTGKMVNLEAGLTFKLERSYCTFIKTSDVGRVEFYKPLKDGVNEIDSVGVIICINSELDRAGYELSGAVTLKASVVCGELFARSRQDGDTVKSGGMTKKIKRIFADRHIPSHKRDLIPLVCDGEGVLAIPGIVARDGAFVKKSQSDNETITIKVYKKRE